MGYFKNSWLSYSYVSEFVEQVVPIVNLILSIYKFQPLFVYTVMDNLGDLLTLNAGRISEEIILNGVLTEKLMKPGASYKIRCFLHIPNFLENIRSRGWLLEGFTWSGMKRLWPPGIFFIICLSIFSFSRMATPLSIRIGGWAASKFDLCQIQVILIILVMKMMIKN